MNPCHLIEQMQRQQQIDALYLASGRHQEGHPKRSLYTGLWQEFQQLKNTRSESTP
jgi:hypothetical protein